MVRGGWSGHGGRNSTINGYLTKVEREILN